MNILFTGVGRRIELLQAFRNASLVLNKKLKIYGADMTGTAPALAYCDYTRSVVAMKDPEYINNLLQICINDHIDLLIPTIDTDLLVLSENKEQFELIGTKVMVSAANMIRICRDKNNTAQFFIDCGLYTPITVNNWKDYTSGFPAFIKPKDGSSSINAFKIENIEALNIYSRQLKDYIIQPFVDGKEYTIDIFCDLEGNLISIVPRERIQVRDGEVLKTRIELDQTMIEEAKVLCSAFRACGPMTVQLIRDKNTGIDYFIEINPRFGGGAPLSMKAGANSAEAILKILDGETVKYNSDIVDGAIYSRFDQSICITENKKGIKGVIFDLDDTLYSEKEYVKSGYKVISEYFGGGYEDTLWNFFEAGKPAIDELLKEIGKEDERDKILEKYRLHKPRICLYDGVLDMLENLRNKGIKIGIITDGRPDGQRNKIESLDLKDKVDDIIITDELGGIQFRKPCDIAFRIIQNRWRLLSNEILYVADNPTKDFQAPKQLGMKYLWFKNKEGLYINQEDSESKYSIVSLKELNSIF